MTEKVHHDSISPNFFGLLKGHFGRADENSHHVYRAESWLVERGRAYRSRHLQQDRAHSLLPGARLSSDCRRRLQVELLRREERRGLLDFRSEAKRWRPDVRVGFARTD